MTEETTAAEEPQEKPIYGNVSIEELEKPEYDEDQINEFMALYEESISGIKEGQIVKGTVVSIGQSEVMVDIGFKSEGAVSIKDPTVIATAELSLFDSSKRQGHRAMGATVVEYLGCPFLVSECDELSVTDLKGEWFVARESRRRAGDIPTVLDQHGNLPPKYSFL